MSFGVVQSAISSIKNNQAQLSKRKRLKNKLVTTNKKKFKLNAPEASKEEIQRIRSKIQRQNKQRNFKLSIVFIIITIAIILLVLSLTSPK